MFEDGYRFQGLGFEGVDGAEVFVDVLQVGVAQEAGRRLRVGAIVEDGGGECMPGTVPGDMLFDSGVFHPSFQ